MNKSCHIVFWLCINCKEVKWSNLLWFEVERSCGRRFSCWVTLPKTRCRTVYSIFKTSKPMQIVHSKIRGSVGIHQMTTYYPILIPYTYKKCIGNVDDWRDPSFSIGVEDDEDQRPMCRSVKYDRIKELLNVVGRNMLSKDFEVYPQRILFATANNALLILSQV